MPDVTPAGPLAVAVKALKDLIAATSFFQTLTGTANATDAAKRIFVGELGVALQSISVASNVVSVRTREPHLISVADVVALEGAAIGEQGVGLNGSHTVTAVADANSFAFALAVDDLEETHLDGVFILPVVRPLLCICEEDESLNSNSIGTNGTSIYSGKIDVLIDAAVPADYRNDPTNALYSARNTFGGLIQAIMEKQGTGDFMVLNGAEPTSAPRFIDRSEQDDTTKRYERWQALFSVSWGLEA